MKNIGALLKKKRSRSSKAIYRTMPLRMAALEIGISSATLHRIEQGRSVRPEIYAKCCKWLGIKPEE